MLQQEWANEAKRVQVTSDDGTEKRSVPVSQLRIDLDMEKALPESLYETIRSVAEARRRFLTRFYSASALLAVHTAVIDRPILSVRLSVCPPVRHISVLCKDERNTIVRFSASDKTIFLVSKEVKFIRIFAGDHLQ